MRQPITIGAAPSEESCAQVGRSNYAEDSKLECRVFRRQILRCHPIPNDAKASLVITSESHDFGTYREVAVRFDDQDEIATDYAFTLERNGPTQWDAIARYELTWFQTQAAYHRAISDGKITMAEIPSQYTKDEPAGPFLPTAYSTA